ncbi:MAG: hypothetical protein AB7O56_06065 [Bauldia sp.]
MDEKDATNLLLACLSGSLSRSSHNAAGELYALRLWRREQTIWEDSFEQRYFGGTPQTLGEAIEILLRTLVTKELVERVRKAKSFPAGAQLDVERTATRWRATVHANDPEAKDEDAERRRGLTIQTYNKELERRRSAQIGTLLTFGGTRSSSNAPTDPFRAFVGSTEITGDFVAYRERSVTESLGVGRLWLIAKALRGGEQ